MKMRKLWTTLAAALLLIAFMSPVSAQEDEVQDITKETIVGPGSIEVKTGKDVLMSFGATARLIPTAESNWDFGLSDNTDSFLLGGLNKDFFRTHGNESGWVKDNYIRTEAKLHFNALPKDRKWSFYAALEYDRPLDTATVDSRGGMTNDDSNFGLERLHVSYALPSKTRFHAGWDVWHLDAMEGAGLVYGDDNPGFWLTRDSDKLDINVGFFKLSDNDIGSAPNFLSDDGDNDRTVYAGYLAWKPDKINKVKVLYAFDRIRDVPANDLLNYLAGAPFGIAGGIPDTDSHHAGILYTGTSGGFSWMGEAVYQFGQAKDVGLQYDDYDINAYALAADFSYDFKEQAGFQVKPHLGIMYTSGDDDPSDDELGGYEGVTNAQRFANAWGGENTIIGDTNMVLGSLIYGYLPELYGNGTPVFTGGVQNYTGFGGGRGDNPGMTLYSAGITIAPKKFLIFRTNVNVFNWNEDFEIYNLVNPLKGPSPVSSGYVGTEWDNEVTFATSKNSFIKGQASAFFPGDGIEEATEALGAKSDDTATRLAMEFIINF
ncbi:Alginate export [Desulfatibacillum alkenivorans DSM 16219]|jgi:hypothetical protein|uniref:Alginate export n=1 Tax=Desulfatibacillum alkenivorans DSM 16219 TaxID=1121393 RepID=A0A1M6CGD5_9BACT|nr:alginate export family protein [Desulfatibacillum alkenivorans]SHI60079.1 Alginate export [Desulfatibacillum alkenivorans DSM 16219]